MKQFFLAIMLAITVPSFAIAQPLAGPVPSTNGTLVNPTINGGSLTGTNVGAANVTPTGAVTAATSANLAAQQGVLLDTFRMSGDADDTASMARAVAAGVPILLGPKTYTINNYSMAGTPASFVLAGVPGKSIIQRTSASGSQFFTVTASNVRIDGVVFDMNRASVTANQWGVFIGSCGQTVTLTRDVFKNNSGSLGGGLAHICTNGSVSTGSFLIRDSEVTGNDWNALYLASVANGTVSRTYVHDNTSTGIFTSSYLTASSTNYSADINITDNLIARNGDTGISAGGYGSPFSFAVSPAFRITAANDTLIDNAKYAISLECDYCRALHNNIGQSSPSVSVFGGIDTLMRYGSIQDNTITLLNTPWGIDVGGSNGMTVKGNIITMNQGSGLNVGGNLNSLFAGNHIMMGGTGRAITGTAIESTGSGQVFPTIASAITITDNTIDLTGSAALGIQLIDNIGGYTGVIPVTVVRNHITATGSGTGAFQAVQWFGRANSLVIDSNDFNGSMSAFADPNVNGDLLLETIQIGGWTNYGSSAGNTNNIRMISTNQVGTYGAGGSILYAYPTSTGSGYTSATILTASGTGGGSGWTGTPMILGGQIIGVRTATIGSGYSGTVTITASDTGGGSGAVIFVGNIPSVPNYAKLTYNLNGTTHLLLLAGAYTRVNYVHPILLDGTSSIQLQMINGGSFWGVLNYTLPTFAIGALPPSNATTCTSAYNGAQITVTGSVSGAWLARCNGTNWIAPSGSTIN